MSVEDPAQAINTVTQLQGAGLYFVSLNIAMTSTGLCNGGWMHFNCQTSSKETAQKYL